MVEPGRRGPHLKCRWLRGALLASTAMIGIAPGLALAAEDAPAAPAAATQLDEIVVTATKRSENIQRVPISITALNTEALEQHQVQNFDDYTKLMPSVSYQSFGPGQSQLFFRGISSGGDGLHGGSTPATGLYLDELPLTTIANNVDLHVYDIERVEALAGPQGTLFGASSLSGTLRIITNKPDPSHFEGGYDLEGNKFGDGAAGGTAEGYVNIPLSDRMAIRLVGFYEHDGGYIDNVPHSRTYALVKHNGRDDPTDDITINNDDLAKNNFNDVDTYGGRAALRINLDDNWTVTPSLIYQEQKANGAFLYDPAIGDLEVGHFRPDYNKDRWYQAAMTIEGKLGNWDMLYSGGYFGRTVDNASDYSYYTVFYDFGGYQRFDDGHGGLLDPTEAYVAHDKYTKQSHELRFTSPADARARLVAGGFYQRQTDDSRADYEIRGLTAADAVPGTQNDIYMSQGLRTDVDYAAFGELAYDIVPNLTLTGGLRVFRAENSYLGFGGFASAADPSICAPTTATNRPCTNDDEHFGATGETHKVNLTWRITPDKMVYATWSTGYRPGGGNRVVGILPYGSDTLTNYEFGWKTSWFDRRLRVNGAAFIEQWHDLQYGISGDNGITSIYNAGNARTAGVEGEIDWLVGGGLTLSASGTYVDAKLTTDFCPLDADQNVVFSCPGLAAAPKGTELPVMPKFKGNLTARYSFDVGPYHSFLQGSVMHQGGTRTYLTDFEADLLGRTDPFTTFDLSVGAARDNWTFELFVQNVFDSRGQLSRNTFCSPSICGSRPTIYPIKPQFFGVKIGQHF
jgi:outer membrane receptor protein involved in Fe transport